MKVLLSTRIGQPFHINFSRSNRTSFGGSKLSRQPISNGARCRAFFNFGNNKNNQAAAQPNKTLADFTAEDVEHYFNYTGMLATEGTYDRLEKMLNSGNHPADLLLLMACGEDDYELVEELIGAGANPNTKVSLLIYIHSTCDT
jgi:ankyrin repeat protein